ncbi:hypothetical protein [Pseudomonas sp. Snoq117.2]|uniref:hypothetical protein n=2 Tax=Pseudomonadota TaxID=1224 RepID=UPI0008C3DC15|nr:hypothetical protein [Pseudomonas sp. Snoq117.2]SEP48099.1 hypothetical protein SAMN02787149_13411 [Pseudomonas sp. Snoq117.2]
MNDLQQKHEQAKSTYAAALANLELARHTYDNGAGKAFAEAKKHRESLATQLDGEKQASERAKATLAEAVCQSNGARTADVTQALSDRRNADDMVDQLSALLSEADRLVESAHAEASTAGRTYMAAYEAAAQRWAEMNVLAALAQCGEQIARAMAVKAPNGLPYPIRYERGEAGNLDASSEQLVIKELRALAEQCDTRPYVQEIGTVDLGAMEQQDVLSAAAIHKRFRTAEVQ